jgi:alpha-1,2-mannosyltransferase
MAFGGGTWPERLISPKSLWSPRRAAALWFAAAVVVFGIGLIAGHGNNPLIDLRVYRDGGLSWLKGLPLYTSRFPAPLEGPKLPFTYPPFAAVAFSGLGLVGYHAAAAVMALIGFSALTWTIHLAARGSSCAASDPATAPKFAVSLTLAALVLEPVSSTLLHGQINLLLMGLVATDALARKTRLPRGVLAGIAAAMKLTPAVFLLYFVARRQWRAAGVMIASFGVATLFGALVAPKDSRTYWTATVFDPSRIGDLSYASNQSIRGAIHRLGLNSHIETIAWFLISMLVIACAYRGARRMHVRSNATGALAVVAACQLLISPVSWSHHWVWIAPMLLPFAARVFWNGTRLRKAVVSAVLGVFLVGPHWLFPNDHGREMYWSWWENIIGDTYMIVTLGFVVWSATARLRTPAKPGAGTGATTETSPRTAEDLLTARQRVASARPVASGAVVEP